MQSVDVLPLLISIFAASLAGFSRGFSGFGAAMIYVPLVTIAYGPITALVTLFLIDILPSLPIIYRSVHQFDRSLVLPMSLGACIASPIGIIILLAVDRSIVQLSIGVFIIILVVRMIMKYEFIFVANTLRSFVVGSISGMIGGALGLYGPPAVLYLLGVTENAKQARKNIFVFLTVESVFLGFYYYFYDMYEKDHLLLSAYLIPFYAFFIWFGARQFVQIDKELYRKIMMYMLLIISSVLILTALGRN